MRIVLGFFRRRKRIAVPIQKKDGGEYIVASPSRILFGELDSKHVTFTDTVESKPRIITRIPPFTSGHDHYTLFRVRSGITVGFPGIAIVRVGENVTIYGVVIDRRQVIASKIECENAVYEIQK